MTTRAELRRSALARRDSISPDERALLTGAITGALESLLNSIPVRILHCYISFRSEVGTREFINRVLERGLKVIVPVVEELDGRQFLIHTEIEHLDSLQHGRFGLEEPRERSNPELQTIDAVVVPCVAFDSSGNRLGYGKGFYDRFLAELPERTARIGLAFGTQEVQGITPESHDQRLDYIITEDGVTQVKPQRRKHGE